MARQKITIRRGLDLPLQGRPAPRITDGNPVQSVAVLGIDFPGIKPSMRVTEGDRVRLGDPLFEDRAKPGVRFLSPGTGHVRAIHRGPRRALRSVVVHLDEPDDPGPEFPRHDRRAIEHLDRGELRELMLAAGLWTALRARPFNHVPSPEQEPEALFVTALDTQPLAADPLLAIGAEPDAFEDGLRALCRMVDGPVYVCCAPGADLPVPAVEGLQVVEFAGPHPAGLPGTHIHFLRPVDARRTAWHLKAQEVVALGRLLSTGRIGTERLVALGGPLVREPRVLRTRLGASIRDLVEGQLEPGDCRIIGGSVLGGHRCAGWGSYLGRYDEQISVLPEESPRRFLHWLGLGREDHTVTRAYLGGVGGEREFRLTTSQNGSPRAMVPIGNFEQVMPLDVLPAPLLKALIVQDTDLAQSLGALELDAEDLALCAYVCPSKYDYGEALRESLAIIEKEG